MRAARRTTGRQYADSEDHTHAIATGTRVSSNDTRVQVFISLYIHNDNIVIKDKVDISGIPELKLMCYPIIYLSH